MPIRPIDLQTLLMQMSQVGRDQAIEKDGPAVLASQQAALAQKRDLEAKEAVGKPEGPADGAPAVKEQGGSGGRAAAEGGEGGEAGRDEDRPDEEVVRDPSLGNKIDLSG